MPARPAPSGRPPCLRRGMEPLPRRRKERARARLLAGWYSAADPSTNKTYYCGPGGGDILDAPSSRPSLRRHLRT